MSKKPCKDHLGNEFDSITAMCKYYGVNPTTFSIRLKYGVGLQEALGAPYNRKQVVDHQGNRFNSITDMCRHWGISLSMYYGRLNKNWSLRDTLETPVCECGRKFKARQGNKCEDHLGNEFDSIKDMCNHYGVSYNTFFSRIYWGMSLKDALTLKICEDHLGNVFSSIHAMCEHYGLRKGTLLSRLYRGWSLKDALETPIHGRRRK